MKKDTLQQLKEGAREGFRQKFFIKEESVSLWIIELANKIINGDLFVKIGSTNDTFQNKEKVALQDLFNQLEDFIDSLIDKAYEEGKRENNEKAILWTLNNIKAFEEEWSKYSGEKTKGEYLIERYKELHK